MVDPSVTDCAGKICASATACNATCANDAGCVSGDYCTTTGQCLPRKANGIGCAANKECVSYACNNGVCNECVGSGGSVGAGSPYCSPTSPACINGSCGLCSCWDNNLNPVACSVIPQAGNNCGLWSIGYCSLSNAGSCNCGSGAINTDCANGRAPLCGGPSLPCQCGSGGMVCPFGKICVSAGVCLIESNFPCQSNAECATGVCNSGVCGLTPVGSGFCVQNSDCVPTGPTGFSTYCQRTCQEYSGC
jgi:hypothetical protein